MSSRVVRGLSRRSFRYAPLVVAVLACATLARPAPASASIDSATCSAAADANGLAGKACELLKSPGKLLSVGKNLVTGHIGSVLKSVFGGGGGTASTASTALGLAAIVTWVVTGARFTIGETTKLVGQTTSPQLRTTWFSSTYWRIAGIAALLTLPFLFAAAVQALIRSELALLTHAALGYLPLATLAIAVSAPLTMLLLTATDQLCAVLTSAAGGGRPHTDLSHALFGGVILGAASLRAPFLLFLIGVITTGGAIALWLELAVREAAVYVVVLMLPLAFAAMVWPARRVWAVRAAELLVALILSKLAIVAVLELGGAALDQLGHHGFGALTAGLAGTVLVILAALSPWAVLRLVPLSELASGAAGSLRASVTGPVQEGYARGKELGLGPGDSGEAEGPTARVRRNPDEQEDLSTNGAEAEIRRLEEQAEPNAASAARSNGSVTDEHRSDLEPVFAAPAAGESETENGLEDAPHTDTSSSRPDDGDGWTPDWSPFLASKDAGPLTLGLDADWLQQEGQQETGGAGDPRSETPTAEDHDPLPPNQDSEEGRL